MFEAICGYYGVQVGTYPDVNNDKQIYFYDNTLTGKQYISYLAELFGGNAKIERDGSCSIIPLKNYTDIEIDTLTSKKLNIGDTYTLTRVCYDNGKLKFQQGGNVIKVEELPIIDIDINSYYYLTTNMKYYKYINVSETETEQYEWQEATEVKNTLYLRTENLFITQQTDIDFIYNAVKDFSITDIECENRIDLSLDAWDIVKFTAENKEYYSFYDNTVNFNGVAMGTIKVSVPLKNVEETTNITGYTRQSQIRRIKTDIDEQNLRIATIVEDIGDRSQKTTSITQDLDRIENYVGDIEDLTNVATGTKTIVISDAYPNENPLEIHIYGNNSVFSYLYPQDDLYPRDNLYPYGDSKIRFYNANEDRIIELGITEVLRANSSVRDELFIDYYGTVQLIRRVNADGTTKINTETATLGTLNFKLIEGNNTFEIVNYIAPIEIKYVTKSEITNVFATKVEMNSSITQTANEINLRVEEKLDEEDFTGANITLAINNDVSSATINADKININGTVSANGNFKIDTDGNMEAVNGKFTGGNIELTDDATEENAKLHVYSNGYETYYMSNGANFYGDGRVVIDTGTGLTGGSILVNDGVDGTSNYTVIQNGSVSALTITQRSLESAKKNFEKLDNGLEIIKNIDIYKYNMKSEDNATKKHIGFVIGDNFKYSKEITSKNNDGVDIYSFVSVCCKAIQEQQEQIVKLEKEIKELKEGK